MIFTESPYLSLLFDKWLDTSFLPGPLDRVGEIVTGKLNSSSRDHTSIRGDPSSGYMS